LAEETKEDTPTVTLIPEENMEEHKAEGSLKIGDSHSVVKP
jgi:hypothetical protein